MLRQRLKTFTFAIPQIAPFIDWGYFVHAWGMPARMATSSAWEKEDLCHDALAELAAMHAQGVVARAAVRLVEAVSQGDDIVLPTLSTRLPMLRQQQAPPGQPCLCLADYIRPHTHGHTDTLGLFATTAKVPPCLQHKADPYRLLLRQTLADRLAEAAAEHVHQLVRTRLWGYAPHEQLTPAQLHACAYQGIRPAVGFPSLPDLSLNFLLSPLLHFSEIGITLTPNGAMQPHCSTSGLMLAHPQARYFAVGPIADDQLADYARRRALSPQDLRHFLPRM